MTLIKLEDFVGYNLLYGVEYGCDGDGNNTLLFNMNGYKYVAECDPEDGYRSSCKELRISDKKMTNIFPRPLPVIGVMRDRNSPLWSGENDHILDVYDQTTNKCVMSIGTGNYDDWYPYCVLQYHPENLTFNAKRNAVGFISDDDLDCMQAGFEDILYN